MAIFFNLMSLSREELLFLPYVLERIFKQCCQQKRSGFRVLLTSTAGGMLIIRLLNHDHGPWLNSYRYWYSTVYIGTTM